MLYLKELISLITIDYLLQKKTVILCLPVLKHFVFLMNNFRSSPKAGSSAIDFTQFGHRKCFDTK